MCVGIGITGNNDASYPIHTVMGSQTKNARCQNFLLFL